MPTKLFSELLPMVDFLQAEQIRLPVHNFRQQASLSVIPRQAPLGHGLVQLPCMPYRLQSLHTAHQIQHTSRQSPGSAIGACTSVELQILCTWNRIHVSLTRLAAHAAFNACGCIQRCMQKAVSDLLGMLTTSRQ